MAWVGLKPTRADVWCFYVTVHCTKLTSVAAGFSSQYFVSFEFSNRRELKLQKDNLV